MLNERRVRLLISAEQTADEIILAGMVQQVRDYVAECSWAHSPMEAGLL